MRQSSLSFAPAAAADTDNSDPARSVPASVFHPGVSRAVERPPGWPCETQLTTVASSKPGDDPTLQQLSSETGWAIGLFAQRTSNSEQVVAGRDHRHATNMFCVHRIRMIADMDQRRCSFQSAPQLPAERGRTCRCKPATSRRSCPHIESAQRTAAAGSVPPERPPRSDHPASSWRSAACFAGDRAGSYRSTEPLL